ncbi:MAG: SusD/RagB family nutrient-binding outer membrane lipoprotein [Chitinophagaceae bacterium]
MKLIRIPLLLLTISLITSCSKSFLDVNTDPNSPTDVPIKTLLPVSTVGLGWASSNELGRTAAILMQYNAGISGNAASYDQWILSSLDNQWNSEIYHGTLNNLEILLSKTEGSSFAYSGIAKLEKAYIISIATDLWGDVPYTEAGKGLIYPQPRFDLQQDIYLGNSSKGVQSLFSLVREGIADLGKASVKSPSDDDIVYNGNLSKWIRAGNSLLLKFALQVSNVAPDTTKAVINAVLTNAATTTPFIDAIDGSLDLNIPFSSANPNAYYLQDFGGSIPNTEMLGNRFLALERVLNDSLRLSKMYTKPAPTFIGYDNASPFAAPAIGIRSVYGNYVTGTAGNAPVRLLTAFRNYFILAEAALMFGTTGDANTYYQNGIKAAMKSVGLTDAEITAYFTANPTIVTLTGTTADKRLQILVQKYVSSVGNAIESYNDYRRTGLPVLIKPLVTQGDDPNTFPKRFPYTSNEGDANPNQPSPRPLTNVKVWWGL